jgi:hypothetical protein
MEPLELDASFSRRNLSHRLPSIRASIGEVGFCFHSAIEPTACSGLPRFPGVATT